jgi:eukaryotic-like serine/threonine-protein kinase
MKSQDRKPSADSERMEELFHAAAALPPDEQRAFLDAACGTDKALQSAVSALLASAGDPATVWERGALDEEARESALREFAARPGEFFGSYRIVRRLAAGGMSVVFEAERDDTQFHKRVAIKVAHQGMEDPAEAARFRAERQILANLEHPNIARLVDGGTTSDGLPYLVMEYVDGVAIDRFFSEQGLKRKEILNEILKVFLQVCAAVQYAHQSLVVHRDLKPANILVTREGTPKLLDFGIAKFMGAGSDRTVRALTPEYASPEQVLGQSSGTASDVYSLGVLLFSLMESKLPYACGAEEPIRLLQAICEEEPVWPCDSSVPKDLRSIISQSIKKEPERRYGSVEQFAADIRRYLSGMPVQAHGDGQWYRLRKLLHRRPLPIAASFALLLAIAGGTISTVRQSHRAQRRFNDVRTLAHSFLFDVYDGIAPLQGSLPVRRMVIARAQQYLDSLNTEAGDDAGLIRELAESYIRLGTVRGMPYTGNLGDTAGALRSFHEAQVLLEREAKRHPADNAVQDSLFNTYSGLSVVYGRQNNSAALDFAQRAATIAEAGRKREPLNEPYRFRLSKAYVTLGMASAMVAKKTKSVSALQQALSYYRRAISIQEEGGPPDKAELKLLGPKYFYAGYALRDLGSLTGDVSYYREALVLSLKGEKLYRATFAADPIALNRRNVSDGLADIGLLRWQCCHDLDGAMRNFSEAAHTFEALAAAETADMEARRDIADVCGKMGAVLGEAGRRTRALQADHKALNIYQELARLDPSSGENAGYISAVTSHIEMLKHR